MSEQGTLGILGRISSRIIFPIVLVIVAALSIALIRAPSTEAFANSPSPSLATSFVLNVFRASDYLDAAGPWIYQGTDVEAKSWTVRLASADCYSNETPYGCGSQRQVKITVVPNASGDVVINTVAGPVPQDAERKLLGQSSNGSSEDSTTGWVFPTAVVAGPSAELVIGAGYWNGPIPAIGMGSRCHAVIREPAGDAVLWRSPTYDQGGPWQERTAFSAGLAFSGVPPSMSSGKAEILCVPWRGDGWLEVKGNSSDIEQFAKTGGSSGWAVSAQVHWGGQPFSNAYSACRAVVRDGSGQEIGRGSLYLASPDSEEEFRTIQIPAFSSTAESSGSNAREANVSCFLVSPAEFEQEGSL